MSKKITKKIAKESELITTAPAGQEAIFAAEGELVVDVFETPAEFVVVSAVAGVQIKDLDISVEKDMMVIRGNRQDPHNHPEKKYFYQECYFGPFSRKIVLPESIATEKASAEIKQGMLTIKIPKITKETASTPIETTEKTPVQTS